MATLHFKPEHKSSDVFDISGKALKLTSGEDIEPILKDLQKLPTVTKIDFNGNTIGVEASKKLSECIAQTPAIYENLQEVNFADLYTSRLVDEVVDSLNYLLPALLKCSNLYIVNLSDNAFGLRTIDILEKFISNAVQLQHLILSNNGMGPFAGERIGKALYVLAENKKKNKKPLLETFICGRNRLENGSTKFLSLGLKNHAEGLKSIKLYQNGIRPTGIITLLKYGLQYNTALEILDLQDNTLTSSAALVLCEYLQKWNKTLKELNLNDCLLKTKGSDALLKKFQELTFENLEVLKLQYNELSHESMVNHLIPALSKKHLPNLKFLELNGNRLEEDSDDLETLIEAFDGELDELDDFEEIDSDEEDEEEEEEEEGNAEKLEELDSAALEKDLKEQEVDKLSSLLETTHI
ncbi:GTPase-activating protein [Hanseniaspora osmophila]